MVGRSCLPSAAHGGDGSERRPSDSWPLFPRGQLHLCLPANSAKPECYRSVIVGLSLAVPAGKSRGAFTAEAFRVSDIVPGLAAHCFRYIVINPAPEVSM